MTMVSLIIATINGTLLYSIFWKFYNSVYNRFLCCIFKNDCCITYIFMEVLNFLNVQDGGYEH